jgi:dinuclear metal center YbgI/SA1388 family protein
MTDTVGDICRTLEKIADPALAEAWDNVGLLAGDALAKTDKLLLTIDLTEPVVRQARRLGCGMVMAYHPPILKPITRITARQSPALWRATSAGISIYSMHTALDAAPGGTNDVLARACGLRDPQPLTPAERSDFAKVVVFLPEADLEKVSQAAFDAGAGHIGNYSHCSFRGAGLGTFQGESGARPTIGRVGKLEEVPEYRLEVVASRGRLAEIIAAIRRAHSYEVPAIDIYPLELYPASTGMGRIGLLDRPVSLPALVARLKKTFGLRNLLVADSGRRRLARLACGAGSCGSMLSAAAAARAEAFVTGELRHHDALLAKRLGVTAICLGHWTSERKTLAVLARRIARAQPGLKCIVSTADRQPLAIV